MDVRQTVRTSQAKQTAVNEPLPQNLVRGEPRVAVRSRTAQLGDDAAAVGHEDDIPARDVAKVRAEVGLEVAHAHGLHGA